MLKNHSCLLHRKLIVKKEKLSIFRQILLKGSLWGQWILSCTQYKTPQRDKVQAMLQMILKNNI